MTHRSGVTLLEVLVAIFITGVGLLALLTLFPLGALEMAQAIQDDRTGHIKANAGARANIAGLEVRSDPFVLSTMSDADGPGPLPPANQNPDAPSYPVFVDSLGRNTYPLGSLARDWVAGVPGVQNGIPRRPIAMLSANEPQFTGQQFQNPDPMFGTPGSYQRQQLLRWTTFLDDITFPRDVSYLGQPTDPNAPSNRFQVERTGRYSWAYLAQQPKACDPGLVNLWVVVYNARTFDVLPNQTPASEVVYTNQANPPTFFNSGGTVLTVTGTGQAPPDVRSGAWVLVYVPQVGNRVTRICTFARVVNVTQINTSTVELEVQDNLPVVPGVALGTQVPAEVYFLDGVIEVFERGTF